MIETVALCLPGRSVPVALSLTNRSMSSSTSHNSSALRTFSYAWMCEREEEDREEKEEVEEDREEVDEEEEEEEEKQYLVILHTCLRAVVAQAPHLVSEECDSLLFQFLELLHRGTRARLMGGATIISTALSYLTQVLHFPLPQDTGLLQVLDTLLILDV